MLEKKDFVKLTQSQLSLWTGQKLSATSPIYNMAHSFELNGRINTEYFQKAFKVLIQNVDVLRTIFIEKNGIPWQSVLETYDYEFEILDFSNKTILEIQTYLTQRSQVSFDFSIPPFDSILIKESEEKYIWFLNVHHIITDATTSTLFLDYLARFYSQQLDESINNQFTIEQYRDYIDFEQKASAKESNNKYKEYWTSKLDLLKSPIHLYGEKNDKKETRSERITLKLDLETSEAIRKLALQKEIRQWTLDLTLFNLFLTTFFVYIYKASGQSKLAIGAPIHNRLSKKFKQTPGLFIEVFPIIGQIQDDDTFLKVFNRIKLETNEYLRNAQPGLMNLDLNRNISIILNYIKASFSDFAGIETKSRWIHPGHSDPGHQMRCTVYDIDGSGEFELMFDLNKSVFDSSLLKKVPQHFLFTLEALLTNINMPIDDLSLADKMSLQPIIKDDSNDFISLAHQFETQVKNRPDSIAICYKDSEFSYRDLNKQVNQLAHYLRSKKIKTDDTIAIHLKRSPEYIIAVLACLKMGVTFVPIPSNQAEKRIRFILKDSESKLLITKKDVSKNDFTTTIETIFFDLLDEDLNKQEAENLNVKVIPSTTCYIIYTSGSTGTPKGVLISHEAIHNYLSYANKTYQTGKPYIFPLFTSIGFDLTITSTFLPLLYSGRLIIYPESGQGPDLSLFDVIKENRVNIIKLTPSHLSLMQGEDYSNSKLLRMIVGGEEFRTNLANTIQDSFGSQLKIFNEYGPTEATVGCIVSMFDKEKHKNKAAVPIGTPIDGVRAYILDKKKKRVTKGVVGELYVSGKSLAKGYVNNKARTNEKFIHLPSLTENTLYSTGDLVRVNKDGEFEYIGRIDEQIKYRGFRIEPTDIEANLLEHKNIENVTVQLMMPSSDSISNGDERLIAIYTGESKVEPNELSEYLVSKIPDYMIPSHYTFLKELPLTGNGKIDKIKLQELNISPIASEITYSAPEGEIEELLENIWKEVLKLKKVGSNNHFISLGGNSLIALRITARINEEVQLNLPLNKVFELPTIREYAKYIETTIIALMNE